MYVVKTKKGWKIVDNLEKEMKKKPPPCKCKDTCSCHKHEMPQLRHFSKKDQKRIIGMGLDNTSNSGDCYQSDEEADHVGMGLGGALSQKDLKGLLGASYDPTDNVNDFQLDKDSSSKTSQVYHNPKTGQTVVAHRGTKGREKKIRYDYVNIVPLLYDYTHQYKLIRDNTTKYSQLKPQLKLLLHSLMTLKRKLKAGTSKPLNKFISREEFNEIEQTPLIDVGIQPSGRPSKRIVKIIDTLIKNTNNLIEITPTP